MSATAKAKTPAIPTTFRTVGALLEHLGGIPPQRVRLHPAPGTATENDILEADRLCELVDGVLVEKPMGFEESLIAGYIIHLIHAFLAPQKLGVVSAPDGPIRLVPGLVRLPDVAFYSWARFPKRKVPKAAIPSIVPDLAIEVLSKSNTPGEMDRKLREYFAAGVQLVWFIDHQTRTARVYTTPKKFATFHRDQSLDGGAVLPGFTLPLREVFDVLGTGK